MSSLLPIVERLADAADHAERADWLFRCPIGIIDREHMTIRRLLQRAGLTAGVAYLETMQAYASATRTPDGTSFPAMIEAVSKATRILKDAV
jgi:hypothetical protein